MFCSVLGPLEKTCTKNVYCSRRMRSSPDMTRKHAPDKTFNFCDTYKAVTTIIGEKCLLLKQELPSQ